MFWRVLFAGIFLVALSVPGVAAAQTVSSATTVSCAMGSSATAVRLGGVATLSWNSQNAAYAVITNIGRVASSGVASVAPSYPYTNYIGYFYGPTGTTTCNIVITIEATAPAVNPSTPSSLIPGGVGGPGVVNAPGTVTPPDPLGGTGGSSNFPSAGGNTITLSNKPGTGLVPCNGPDCQACHIATLSQNIINFLLGLSIPVAAALFAYAGMLYFTSSVMGRLERAKRIFKTAFIGFAVILGAWLVVQTVIKTIVAEEFENWSVIKCVDDGKRARNESISTLIQSAIPGLNTQTPVAIVGSGPTGGGSGVGGSGGEGSAWTCGAGYNYAEAGGEAWCQGSGGADDWKEVGSGGPNYSTGSGNCGSGYVYMENQADGAWCQGPGGVDDWKELTGSVTGPSGGPSSTDRTCNGCKEITGAFAIKNNNKVTEEYNSFLDRFGSALKGQGLTENNLTITEAFPPTANHKATCHYTGECTDIALRSRDYNVDNINAIQSAARDAGGCAVYETAGSCPSGLVGKCLSLPGWITGTHFSLYRDSSCR